MTDYTNKIRKIMRTNILLASLSSILLSFIVLNLFYISFYIFIIFETLIATSVIVLYDISKWYEKKAPKLKQNNINVLDKAALIKQRIFEVFLILLTLFLLPFTINSIFNSLISTQGLEALFVLLTTYLLLLIINKVVRSKNNSTTRTQTILLPELEITNNSFYIKFHTPLKPIKKVIINFNEIKSLKELKPGEAQAFVNYRIWQRVDWKIKAMTEYHRYIEGKIKRPSIFIQYFLSPNIPTRWLFFLGTTLLIEGKDLLYLITVRKKQAEELKKAYESYKSTRLSP